MLKEKSGKNFIDQRVVMEYGEVRETDIYGLVTLFYDETLEPDKEIPLMALEVVKQVTADQGRECLIFSREDFDKDGALIEVWEVWKNLSTQIIEKRPNN